MRILVVDDESIWRTALCGLYERALGRGEHAVDSAATASEALRLLERERYDILSLDINLSKDALRDSDGSFVHASGMDVLDHAKAKGRIGAVIVVSGCTWDHELVGIFHDETRRIEIRGNMPTILERLFPNRSHFCAKPSPSSEPDANVIDRAVDVWQKTITRSFLSRLASGLAVAPPYVLELDVRLEHARIRSARTPKEEVSVANPNDIRFLVQLAQNRIGESAGVTHQEAATALLGHEPAADLEVGLNLADGRDRNAYQKRVHHHVEMFRKRMRDIGLDPSMLLESWRTKAGGFRLPQSVRIEGFGSANPRAVGSGDGGFSPAELAPSAERSPQDLVADAELEAIRERLLSVASREQRLCFDRLTPEQQELLLELFARHERRSKPS
jgi:CheY-like chemotaxis protein